MITKSIFDHQVFKVQIMWKKKVFDLMNETNIFKFNIVNFLIIHVVINFNGNHHKKIWMNSKKIMDS